MVKNPRFLILLSVGLLTLAILAGIRPLSRRAPQPVRRLPDGSTLA